MASKVINERYSLNRLQQLNIKNGLRRFLDTSAVSKGIDMNQILYMIRKDLCIRTGSEPSSCDHLQFSLANFACKRFFQ